MKGNPANLTLYNDYNVEHDHTYHGNGCPNGWGTDGDGGSITPCSTNILKTGDNEDQYSGTNYNFQAATAGTGGPIETDNTNSSDTFCPLGWQLPYGGTGGDYYNKSRSWRYLISEYNIPSDTTGQVIVRSYPFSYVYTGYFYWGKGRLYSQGDRGSYWPSTINSSTGAYLLNTWPTGVDPAATGSKAVGVALRCDCEISILE